ncbi:MAG: glycosyltransferase [Chloroflexota bacterium]|nr:glycosyltransferase [Chloroflexota bacterium]
MTRRVLLVSAEYPPMPGGVGDYTALLARSLADSGASVAVLTSATSSRALNDAITLFPVVRRWDWRVARLVRAVVKQVRPDVLHLQFQTGMYGMHPAINLLPGRVPFARGDVYRYAPEPHLRPWFVTTFHDLRPPYLFPKAGPLRGQVMYRLARDSDAAIATNGADRQTLEEWNRMTALIPIGSNIPPASVRDGQAIRARYGIPADAPLLTTFGLLNQSKGIEMVLDALALLRREGTAAHLLLIGAGAGANDPTNRATEAAVDKQCAAAGLTAFVHRTGPLPAADVAEALAVSDVCLLPYRDGASPRRGSLLAALAQGIPVVTTTPAPAVYDGLPDFRDGEVARCVPAANARAIAEAVQAILRDDLLAARLRAGAAAYAQRFTWPAIATQTLALYDTLGVTVTGVRTGPVVASGVER